MIYVLSGGAGLNLKVVGGTTQPTSPKENTVWVNTSTAINGYVFSATKPTSPVAGMVWFQTGTTSSAAMNIDKKNTVMLYPGGCQQYVSGAWVRKDAQTWDGTKWKPWRIYLFDGSVNTALTGGINGTIQNKRIRFSASVAAASNNTYTTKQSINVTSFKTIKAKIISTTSLSGCYFRLGLLDSARNGSNISTSAAEAYKQIEGPFTGNEQTVSVDISDISGNFYPFYAWGVPSTSSDKTINGDILEWWCEQ